MGRLAEEIRGLDPSGSDLIELVRCHYLLPLVSRLYDCALRPGLDVVTFGNYVLTSTPYTGASSIQDEINCSESSASPVAVRYNSDSLLQSISRRSL